MKPNDIETIRLHFKLAHEACTHGDYESAQSHSQKGLHMIESCLSQKKQSKMAIETIGHRHERKAK